VKDYDWKKRAREALNASYAWEVADSDAELRMHTVDMHAALEDTVRLYLEQEHGVVDARDKRTHSFPSIVRLLQHRTGDAVLDRETVEAVRQFNALRNRVVHKGYVPYPGEVQAGARLVLSVLRRLLETQRVGFPSDVIGYDFGHLPLKKTSRVLMVLAALYVILPDLLPLNPLDDLLVGGPCFLVGLILMIIVSMQREDS
jgi:hypothetical protein